MLALPVPAVDQKVLGYFRTGGFADLGVQSIVHLDRNDQTPQGLKRSENRTFPPRDIAGRQHDVLS